MVEGEDFRLRGTVEDDLAECLGDRAVDGAGVAQAEAAVALEEAVEAGMDPGEVGKTHEPQIYLLPLGPDGFDQSLEGGREDGILSVDAMAADPAVEERNSTTRSTERSPKNWSM